LGPKQVLSNMIKDIDPSASRINMEDIDSLERTVGRLAQQIEA